MILARQPIFKDGHIFFRLRSLGRGQLSNTHAIQHNRGEIIGKRSKSFKKTRPPKQGAVSSDPSVSIGEDELDKLRLGTKKSVENIIRNKFGYRFSVRFFGSVHYGVSYPQSDLDMVVIDHSSPQGHRRMKGVGEIYSVQKLAHILSRAGFTNVTSRASASVPIVKFHDPSSGLDCDINVNDRLGILNSTMIKEYCDAHPYLRPLLYRIKEWAKPLGLNSPSPTRGSSVSFSSYAFALMTISFLQKEGHLPNLQEDDRFSIKPNKKALIWTRKPHRGWDVRFRSAKGWVPPPLPDIDTLLSSLFKFWIDFPYKTESMSIRHGGTTPRVINITTSKKSKQKTDHAPISVRDPFILTKNVTAGISKKTFECFITECQNKIELLP